MADLDEVTDHHPGSPGGAASQERAVTDHAGYLGIMPLLLEKGNPIADTEIGKEVASGDPKKLQAAFGKQLDLLLLFKRKPIDPVDLYRRAMADAKGQRHLIPEQNTSAV